MIKIRPLNESDEDDIAQILNKTWNFDGENDELLESRMYFLECMTNASYARVATVDGKVAGVLIAANLQEEHRNWNVIMRSVWLKIKQFFIPQEEVVQNWEDEEQILQTLEEKLPKNYDAELNLFVVSPEFRGYGIGSKLYRQFEIYLKKQHLKSYFLHTDTGCAYKFYEHKGLKRKAMKKSSCFYAIKDHKPVTFFIYGNV